jgi:Tol biopolymer transport system component
MAYPSRYLTTMAERTTTSPFAFRRRALAALAALAVGSLLAAGFGPAPATAAIPHFDGAAADGSVVFFTTTEKLAVGDTDNRRDVYERTFDPAVGESGDYVTREVSTGPIGGNAAFDAFFEGQSADGTKAFFSTRERLTSADTDQATDLYVRDLSTGVTSLVSAGGSGCTPGCGNGGADAGFAGASADGNEVFFVTTESLTPADQDETVDVYMRDLVGGSTVLVSAGAAECAPSCGNGGYTSTLRGISADGSHAFFATAEPLVSADGDTALDIYSRALPNGPTELVSAGSPGCSPCGNGVADAVFAGSSADGTRAFFETSEGLVGGDTDGGNDVYERSGGTTTLVSGGTSGAPANIAQASGSGRPAISSDGTKVLFVTAEPLVGGDTNEASDIYLWSGGSPSLVTSGTCTQGGGSCGSTFDAATPDLETLLFTTTERLVSGDTDSSADVYEAPTAGGSPVLASTGSPSCAPCGNGAFDAIFNAASANASKVFFTSGESLVAGPGDEDNSNDIYARDLTASTTTLSSPPGECPIPAGCPVVFSGVSEDGSHVFFQTEERLTGADNDSEIDIYERAAGQTRLVSQGNSAVLGPSTPVLTATNPASPNPSTTPSILGQSDPNSSVKVYTTGDCSGEPVATGTAAELGSPGIAVSVAPGTSRSFRATATDQNGDTSGCSAPLTYTQGEPPPPPPGEEPPAGETPGGGGTGAGGGTTGSGGGTSSGGKTGGAGNRVGAGPGNNGGTYVTPRTLITYGPAFKTKKRRPVFLFTDATGQPGTSFFCKLDRHGWHSCGSPLKLSRLGAGKHVLRIKGVNALGVGEEKPVQRSFQVVG